MDRSAGAQDCADAPGIRDHGGGGAWVAARRGRARGRRCRGGAGFADLGSGLQAITQHGLQTFLWHELPRKWLTDLEGKLHIAASLRRLLELVGLRRYAAICRGPETTAVLQAYERSSREGFRGFRRAQERSGVEPPARSMAWPMRPGGMACSWRVSCSLDAPAVGRCHRFVLAVRSGPGRANDVELWL